MSCHNKTCLDFTSVLVSFFFALLPCSSLPLYLPSLSFCLLGCWGRPLVCKETAEGSRALDFWLGPLHCSHLEPFPSTPFRSAQCWGWLFQISAHSFFPHHACSWVLLLSPQLQHVLVCSKDHGLDCCVPRWAHNRQLVIVYPVALPAGGWMRKMGQMAYGPVSP